MTLLPNLGSKTAVGSMTLFLLFYRSLLAPALQLFGATPSCCRFLPTCSDYAQEAVRQHGWKGIALATRRLLRCRPHLFSTPDEQGIRLDPVTPRTNNARPPLQSKP